MSHKLPKSNVASWTFFSIEFEDLNKEENFDCFGSIVSESIIKYISEEVFDVTVEIIGVGEVEMSNNNFIDDLSTPFFDQRFGGVDLPFKVTNGTFDHWEVISSSTYIYDPNVDTLVLNLQSDVIVRAYFGESRDFVFDINPLGTATSIDINGVTINAFPYTTSLLVGENINLSPNIDALYAFDSWSSDSNILSPSTLVEAVSFTVGYSDTIKLHLYEKPTIVYNIDPPGTSTTIDVNGVNVSVFPYSENVFIDALNTISPNIDPSYGFGSWTTNYNTLLNGSNSINNSFYGVYTDTITLKLDSIMAYMSGNDTICCLLYTSPSPRDRTRSRMPSSA